MTAFPKMSSSSSEVSEVSASESVDAFAFFYADAGDDVDGGMSWCNVVSSSLFDVASFLQNVLKFSSILLCSSF